MEKKSCSVCLTKPTPLQCDMCHEPSCKICSIYVDEDSFELFDHLPDSIRGKMFCPSCFNANVDSVLSDYQEALERAKDIDVFDITQGTETRLIKRIEKPIKVVDCKDREETLMRLAFQAAQRGCNTLVDTKLTSKKVQDGKWKKYIWSGTAVPVKR